jgi:protein O-GlcNAc transferase
VRSAVSNSDGNAVAAVDVRRMHPSPEKASRQAFSELAARNWAAARILSERVLAATPDHAEALHALALSLWGEGDIRSAVQVLTRAGDLAPHDASLLSDLGVLRYEQEDWAGAAEAFKASLAIEPNGMTARRGYAESLLQMRQISEARRALEECTRLSPGHAGILRSLGSCMALEGSLQDAEGTIKRSLEADPSSERGLLLLAAVVQKQKRFELCVKYTEAAVQLYPDSFTSRARLAIAYWDVGDLKGAMAARSAALRLVPDNRNLHSNLTWLCLHDPNQTAESLLQVHRETAVAWSKGKADDRPFLNSRERKRRLRIGYVSGEFMSNPAYCFLLPWLASHDPEQVETFYYMSRPRNDAHTAQYRRVADHWRDVANVGDEALAARIRCDQIDILVDVSGHFDDNRLGAFSLRPAPIQATFPNYPSTTGVDSIDYIFTDRWTTPEGCDDEYAEKPYRLPSGYLVFQLPEEIAEVRPLPALLNGFVTFGLFQRPGKLHTSVWNAIAAIMAGVPGSQLLVHFASADLDEEGSAQRNRVLEPLRSRGIERERVLFRGTRFSAEHLAVVGEADIALDTFPYNGQTTTCDCLWMGVPVVSLRGNSHVSRVTPAILERVGLGSLAACSEDEYVRIAVRLAGDLSSLACTRVDLRKSMQSGLMGDGVRLAREIEAAYRWMWDRWCAQ